MQYTFSPYLLLRSPVKKPENYTNDCQGFLDDLHFLAALYIASPTFYAVLGKHQFTAVNLSARESVTLKKYINRYCFRPTPFGLFASISLATWADIPEVDRPSSDLSTYISPSVSVQNTLGSYWLEHHLNDQARFTGNPSIYRVLNEYRFFRTGLDESGRHREYQLQSIAFSKLLKDILHLSSKGTSREEIVRKIEKLTKCGLEESEDYAEFLIDAQFLINTDSMSITGPDHLKRLIRRSEGSPYKDNITNLLPGHAIAFNNTKVRQLVQFEKDLQALYPIQELPEDKLNVILKRNSPPVPLKTNYQQKLRDGIAALEMLSAPGTSGTMTPFINSFQQYFEGQTLPLLQALDPESGVGYQHPETEKNPLLETLHIPQRRQSKPSPSWSIASSILLERWLKEKSAQVIRVTESDLNRLKKGKEPAQILGMSVLFRVIENKVFIENAGGNNAPALMGRFTVADEGISKAAKMMAQDLETKNPDIIFAELLHLSDPHTDNVNRRTHIYQFELPILAASTLPAEQQLQLSDLYVRIIDNKVMLYSGRHQKFVVPRLTSAYNHSLNKLPLFRFLADLPYQYGRSYLGLELRQLFPDLHFYPRVEYKEAILCLATWIITERQIRELLMTPGTGEAFAALSSAIQLPRYFSLAEGDQELVFDGQNYDDITFFCSCIRQKQEVVLKEFPEQPEVRQYNAYLLPERPLVFPKPVPIYRPQKKVLRKYLPGSSWLYLKVYAPKTGVDRLLLRLAPLLRKSYGGSRISQWFFIRYEDHAPHIRLRLQVKPDSISEILLSFKTNLEDRIQQHVIREFQIDVYSRELERYAAGGIENSERFFWASSELVLQFLKNRGKNAIANIHVFALYSTLIMIGEFIDEADEQIKFTLNSYQRFLPEFTERSFKADLDRKYRELSTAIRAAFRSRDPALLSGSLKAGQHFRRSLQVIRKQMSVKPDQNYLHSIIHMHFNRIFTDESRKQEMICYYLLHKYLLSEKGRNQSKQQSN